MAVPTNEILPIYKHWKNYEDIAPERLEQIKHFFEHYKDLEEGKWVKIEEWCDVEYAKEEIMNSTKNYIEKKIK